MLAIEELVFWLWNDCWNEGIVKYCLPRLLSRGDCRQFSVESRRYSWQDSSLTKRQSWKMEQSKLCVWELLVSQRDSKKAEVLVWDLSPQPLNLLSPLGYLGVWWRQQSVTHTVAFLGQILPNLWELRQKAVSKARPVRKQSTEGIHVFLFCFAAVILPNFSPVLSIRMHVDGIERAYLQQGGGLAFGNPVSLLVVPRGRKWTWVLLEEPCQEPCQPHCRLKHLFNFERNIDVI